MLKGGSMIAKIHQRSGRILTRKFKEHGIRAFNHSQGRILFALWQHDGSSMQELASITALNISTLSLMLDRLETAGHIRRVSSTTDKRKTLIYATGSYSELQSAYQSIIGNLQEVFYTGFTEDEVQTAENMLERIYSNLVRYAESEASRKDLT